MFGETTVFWKVVALIPVLPVYFIIFLVVYSFTEFYTKEMIIGWRPEILVVVISFYFCAIMTFVCHTISMLTDAGKVSRDFHQKMVDVHKGIEYYPDGLPKVLFKSGNTVTETNEIVNADVKVELAKKVNTKSNVSSDTQTSVEESESLTQSLFTEEELLSVRRRNPFFCSKCSIWRPERAHHCGTCNRCVLVSDHHCPWIANCVGYKNHRNFVQFLFYATVGDFIAFLCLGYKLLFVDTNVVNYLRKCYPRGIPRDGLGVYQVVICLKQPLIHLSGAIFSLAMALAIGALMGYQIYQICKGITSIENTKKISNNKHMTKMQNFKEIMGKSLYFWLEPFTDIPDYKYVYFRVYMERLPDVNGTKTVKFIYNKLAEDNVKDK